MEEANVDTGILTRELLITQAWDGVACCRSGMKWKNP